MDAVFIIIIIFLCAIVLIQHNIQKQRNKNIKYMHDKLEGILANSSSEKLLVFTDDGELSRLLIAINKLLDNNRKTLADYVRSESAMRKMLSNISHDLKTPLTVVLGYIETVRLDPDMDSEEREKLLCRVHDKAIEVLELINKFFDLAKLESGDKDLTISRINMNEVCRKGILDFYDILSSKGIEVKIDIPDESIYAFANEEGLERVLSNLISNAIKYGSDGKIIGLQLTGDREFVYVDIWDRGKGIDEVHQNRVFERLYTLDDSRNKVNKGSGLGLTITKRLIEKMGGEIKLQSRAFEKTIFTFKLKRVIY